MRLLKIAGIVVLILFLPSASGQQQEPVETSIVEQAERRLMQIDVTVRGPKATLAELTERDFRLTVGRDNIDEFVLDQVCIGDGIEGFDLSDPEVKVAVPKLRTLLYFDQTHLTSRGRRRSIELAQELIPRLLASGLSEAMIVSASRQLKLVSEWSSDADALIATLNELLDDTSQISMWANQEDLRVDRMMAAIDRVTELTQVQMRDTRQELAWSEQRENMAKGIIASQTTLFGGTPAADPSAAFDAEQELIGAQGEASLDSIKKMARVVARDLSREEASHTAGGLSMFSAALAHMEGYAPPKAIIYFADTMRANAGDFYIGLVQSSEDIGRLSSSQPGGVALSRGNYVSEFQQSIDLATEKGVRLYTVQGRGLTPAVDARTQGGSARAIDPGASRARYKDAENALVGFARETGGKSFLGAADATQIASRILDDLSCLFVLSFHALDQKEDRSTPVWIEIDKPGIELQYRPRLIALSEKARTRIRLASAFWSGDRSRESARVVAVPTGFEKGKYTVLVQFAIPGSPIAGSDWDMGLTAVFGGTRTQATSGRVAVNQPGLPLIFEAEMRFKPGEFTITAVAENNDHGQVISTKIDGTLPNPDDEEPFVASVVMLQRANGAFVRGEATKTSGSLAHGDEHWLSPDRPVGILALVCGNKRAGSVTAGRSLEGASEVSFDTVEHDFTEERCALLVDSIDANVLTSGRFSYAIDLNRGEETVAESLRDFLVVSKEEISLAKKEPGGPGE
jgi:VWFA-related protein